MWIPEGYNVKLSIYVKISTLGACTEVFPRLGEPAPAAAAGHAT